MWMECPNALEWDAGQLISLSNNIQKDDSFSVCPEQAGNLHFLPESLF